MSRAASGASRTARAPRFAPATTTPRGRRAAAPAGCGDAREDLHAPILQWYAEHGRDLPWRRPDCGAWGVFCSEVMSQQTPLSRVEPAWRRWMARWPTPADLAADSPGEAVRLWDRLGYPRRALRLHEAAGVITREHDGVVPEDVETLLTLPGVGAYTAAAVAAFAYGRRSVVVDTNVRRVQARAVTGVALPAPALTAAETRLAQRLLPADDGDAARWNVAVMELGALVCTARSPDCGRCPVVDRCAWQLAGAPADDGPPRRAQAWVGTDRQVRGTLMAVLRAADAPVPRAALLAAWPADPQRADRCLHGLVQDGLAEPVDAGRFTLPR